MKTKTTKSKKPGAVIKNFFVKLTPAQVKIVETNLLPLHRKKLQYYTLALQCKTHAGCFRLPTPKFHIAVLTRECGEGIAAVLDSYRTKKQL